MAIVQFYYLLFNLFSTFTIMIATITINSAIAVIATIPSLGLYMNPIIPTIRYNSPNCIINFDEYICAKSQLF